MAPLYKSRLMFLSPIQQGRSDMEQRLKDHATNQLEFLTSEPSAVPGSTGSMGDRRKPLKDLSIELGTRQEAWPRIRRSLTFLKDVLTGPGYEHLDSPIAVPGARGAFTSPRLLIVQALLHGHRGWSRPYHHDAWSAIMAHEALRSYGLSDAVARWIAVLIMFQSMMRSGLSKEPREVGVWDGSTLSVDRQVVGLAIHREIHALLGDKAWQNAKVDPVLVIGLAAVCLEARDRGRRGAEDSGTDEMSEWFVRLRELTEVGPSNRPGTLCYFEFGNYILKDQPELQDVARTAFASWTEKDKRVAFLSFGRFWSSARINDVRPSAVTKTWSARLCTSDLIDGAVSTMESIPWLKQHQPVFKRIEVDPKKQCDPPDASADASETWEAIAKGIAQFSNERSWSFEGGAYLPLPYVGRLLRELQQRSPRDFVQVRLVWGHDAPGGFAGDSNTLFLPRQAPTTDNLDTLLKEAKSARSDVEAYENRFKSQGKLANEIIDLLNVALREERKVYRDPQLVVARYAASAILNRRMAIGAGRLDLVFDCDEMLAQPWRDAISWVEKKNNHDILRRYLNQVASPHHRALAERPAVAPSFEVRKKGIGVLCLDVGGTSVKGELWRARRSGGKLDLHQKTGVTFEFPTEPDEGKYANAASFSERILRTYREMREQRETHGEKDLPKIHIIGISWPGPVAGPPGAEYIAATSGILARFEGLERIIDKNTPEAIHGLDVRSAIEDIFATKRSGNSREVIARMINDGEGHTRASLEQLEGAKDGSGDAVSRGTRVTIVLTAGTGTALGVVRTEQGGPANVLAELGKLIINLVAPFPSGGFPAGIVRNQFSRDTHPAIGRDILDFEDCGDRRATAYSADYGDVDPFEISRYLAKAEVDKLKRDLAGNLDDQRREKLQARKERADAQAKELPKQQRQNIDAKDPRRAGVIREVMPGQSSTDEELMQLFASTVAQRGGCLLADVIALTVDLFQAERVFATGGPISGVTGERVRDAARAELTTRYGFDVTGGEADPDVIHYVRRLDFPEPGTAESRSGAWGAGAAALELLTDLYRDEEVRKVEAWIRRLDDSVKIELKREHGSTRLVADRGSAAPNIVYHTMESLERHLNAEAPRLGLLAKSKRDAEPAEFVKLDPPDPILTR